MGGGQGLSLEIQGAVERGQQVPEGQQNLGVESKERAFGVLGPQPSGQETAF